MVLIQWSLGVDGESQLWSTWTSHWRQKKVSYHFTDKGRGTLKELFTPPLVSGPGDPAPRGTSALPPWCGGGGGVVSGWPDRPQGLGSNLPDNQGLVLWEYFFSCKMGTRTFLFWAVTYLAGTWNNKKAAERLQSFPLGWEGTLSLGSERKMDKEEVTKQKTGAFWGCETITKAYLGWWLVRFG